MADREEPLKKVKLAKKKAVEEFGEHENVCGIGITQQDGSWCVKINLVKEMSADSGIPKKIDGFAVCLLYTSDAADE